MTELATKEIAIGDIINSEDVDKYPKDYCWELVIDDDSEYLGKFEKTKYQFIADVKLKLFKGDLKNNPDDIYRANQLIREDIVRNGYTLRRSTELPRFLTKGQEIKAKYIGQFYKDDQISWKTKDDKILGKFKKDITVLNKLVNVEFDNGNTLPDHILIVEVLPPLATSAQVAQVATRKYSTTKYPPAHATVMPYGVRFGGTRKKRKCKSRKYRK